MKGTVGNGSDNIDVVGDVAFGLADVLQLFAQVFVDELIFVKQLVDLGNSAKIKLFLFLFADACLRDGDAVFVGFLVRFSLVLHKFIFNGEVRSIKQL